MENSELKEKYQKLISKYPYIEKNSIYMEDEKIVHDISYNNESIYAIEKNNYLYYLNSRYSCKNETEIIINNINANNNIYAPILVFGIGNGLLLKELRKKFPENNIYIHEPSMAIFRCFLNNVSSDELDSIFDEHVVLTVGNKMEGAMVEIVHGFINEQNFYLIDLICTPQYQNIFGDEYLKFIRTIHTRTEEVMMQKNTDLVYNDEHIATFWENVTDIISQYGASSLAETLRENDSDKYAAFIIAAGPSLDKNINQLKKINGRGIIMAVDTAIKPLVKKGIIPDFVASVDPHKPLELFECKEFGNLPMLVDINSNSKVLKIHHGHRFYGWSGERFMKILLEEIYPKLGIVESGGSVACNLFYLALMCGFKTIVFVGQDLAYPNGQGHSIESYNNEDSIDVSQNRYFKVEDIYGGMVYTEKNMNAYRKWFEATISRYSNVRFIDATEGGAKINGAEVMKLEEAINECCVGKNSKDWNDIISKCPPLMSREQQLDTLKKIKNIPRGLEKIERLLNKSDKWVKSADIALKNKNVVDLKKALNSIIKIDQYLDKQLEMKLLEMYNAQGEYFISMAVYKLEKNQDDDIKSVIRMCELTNQRYREVLDKAKQDAETKSMKL